MKMRKTAVVCLAGMLAFTIWGCEKEDNSEKNSREIAKAESTGPGKYCYEYENQKVYITQPIEEAVEILGEDYEYFEAPSCASEGVDMFYYYQNITLMANEKNDEKIVTQIYFKNDTVSTPEGIRINSSYADVVNQYGSDYTMNGTALEYSEGSTLLVIDVRDGKVVSIEYEYK